MAERQKKTIANRNYGVDFLRIISMFMVVLLHVLKQGGILDSLEPFSLKYEFTWFIEIASLCAVNCYALTSGYVGVYAKHKYSNLALLWLRVFYYSVIITLCFFFIFPETVGKKAVVSSLFPVMTNQYWYFSTYFFLFLLMPVLNLALTNLDKKALKYILLSVVLLGSVLLPVFQMVFVDPFKLGNGYSVLWLMVLYLIGGYIRKYGMLTKLKSISLFLLYILSISLTWCSKLIIQIVTKSVFGEIKYDQMWVSYISITIVIAAICLFLVFERINVNLAGMKLISLFAPMAFSVFLIHTHPLVFEFMKNRFIWVADLPLAFMFLSIIAIAICVYFMCSLLDIIREWLFRILSLKNRLDTLERLLKRKIKD